jgi:hypothetical protein
MPSSTLDRSRTRAKPSDWVVVVPGRQPVDRPEPAELAAPVGASPQIRPGVAAFIPSVARPVARPTLLPSAVSRFVLMVGLVGAFVAVLGLVTGRNPLLVFGLATPHFVAYQGESAEQVRFVLDDGWSQTAAVPGALLMDWSEGRAQPAMRLTMGNPTAEPEVSGLSADGNRVEAILYRAVWPGVDAEIKAQPGGFSGNFIVEPGVNPAVIELEYVGATELTIDGAGRLHIRGQDGLWIDGTPESWQDGPSGREPVASHYELRGGGRFGFIVGGYDPSRPLTVDPPSERVN